MHVLEMPREKSEYRQGENPASQANLSPRAPIYEETKKRRYAVVTDKGWEGLKALSSDRGISLSELLERVGRGLISLGDRSTPSESE